MIYDWLVSYEKGILMKNHCCYCCRNSIFCTFIFHFKELYIYIYNVLYIAHCRSYFMETWRYIIYVRFLSLSNRSEAQYCNEIRKRISKRNTHQIYYFHFLIFEFYFLEFNDIHTSIQRFLQYYFIPGFITHRNYFMWWWWLTLNICPFFYNNLINLKSINYSSTIKGFFFKKKIATSILNVCLLHICLANCHYYHYYIHFVFFYRWVVLNISIVNVFFSYYCSISEIFNIWLRNCEKKLIYIYFRHCQNVTLNKFISFLFVDFSFLSF